MKLGPTTWIRPWSLRRRLMLTTAGVLCLGIAWLTWWQVNQLRPLWWQALESSLVDTATVLAAQVAAASSDGNPDAKQLARAWNAAQQRPVVATISGSTKQHLALAVSLTDRHGIVLFDSARPEDVRRDNSQWNDVLLTLRGAYGARATLADPSNLDSASRISSATRSISARQDRRCGSASMHMAWRCAIADPVFPNTP